MILVLLGCSGATIDGGGMFPVLSAFSFPSWDAEIIGPGGRGSGDEVSFDHSVSLSDVTLGCVRAQGYQKAWNDASEALLAASDDGNDAEAVCAAMPDFLDQMDAAERNYPAQMQRVSFGFCVDGGGDAYCGGDVEPGDYALGENADMGGGEGSVYGYYSLDRAAEPILLADYWRADDCAMDFEALSADTEGDGDDGYTVEGTITVTGGDGQVLSGTWDGTLVAYEKGLDLDGNETSGNFSTALCEVEHADTVVVWWW